ncbi:3843_t:CDS:2 [Scutellospora calospora]|uniref:3843_t:CDS:1 n=1 Tax=Scutellospora calospora TaxID=85575 RepID=A0ACA9KNI2_9GLOM|nr:3843_t:CDS:2 [Scutellospora calospora]
MDADQFKEFMALITKCKKVGHVSYGCSTEDQDSENNREDSTNIIDNNLAFKYNRNLIINTTPTKHKSLFSRASSSKHAVCLNKNTGPSFGTTDLIVKDGKVTCKSECYSLNLLEKIVGEISDFDSEDDEDIKSYQIEEYEVYHVKKKK